MACPRVSAAEPANLTITVDLQDEKQTIKAFGASDCWSIQYVGLWPDEKRNAIADLLFSTELDDAQNPRGIGLSSWRFNLGAGSTRDTNRATRIRDPWRRADTFLNDTYDGYDWTRLPGQQWFLQAARQRGVAAFTLFTNSPPVNLTKNGLAYCGRSVGDSNLPMHNAQAFADYLADVLVRFRDASNIAFEYVSPFNEPQWDWNSNSQEGCRYSNANIRHTVRILHQTLNERGLATKILIPEAGDITYLYSRPNTPAGNQITQFFDPSSDNYLADKIAPIITGHSYWSDTPAWNMISKRQSLKTRLDAFPNVSYLMSEYCILGNDGSGREIAGNGRDLGMDAALRLARTIHYDLTLTDAVGWDWWTAVSPYNYKDGLVYIDKNEQDGNYDESKMLWAMGNYSRFVRPGMRRVQTHRSDKASPAETVYGLMASGYKNQADNQVVVVIVNASDRSNTIALQVKAPDRLAAIRTWTAYVTSDAHSLTAQHPITEKTIPIPARAIVTLVGAAKE